MGLDFPLNSKGWRLWSVFRPDISHIPDFDLPAIEGLAFSSQCCSQLCDSLLKTLSLSPLKIFDRFIIINVAYVLILLLLARCVVLNNYVLQKFLVCSDMLKVWLNYQVCNMPFIFNNNTHSLL